MGLGTIGPGGPAEVEGRTPGREVVRYRFAICDVFTDTRFGGNPLAVLPESEGLSSEQMQQIAREFNFSESTFVLPPEQGNTRRVRIFTPSSEIPFAGHPNVGTAFALATLGELGDFDRATSVVFEEEAGLVPVRVERRGDGVWCELSAPQTIAFGPSVEPGRLAPALALQADEIVATTHPPQVASVGLPFLFVELRDRAALERARVDRDVFQVLVDEGFPVCIHVYLRSNDDFDVRARMYAPFDEIEDPATGSANCALAGLLASKDDAESGALQWRIAQGVEMGRPSLLEARAQKRDGAVVATFVGGASVLVAEGAIEVG